MKNPLRFSCLVVLLCLGLGSTAVRAAEAQSDPASADSLQAEEKALQQVEKELNTLERRWYGLMRFRWSYPQKFSAGIGAVVVEQPRDLDCAVSCMLYGWHFGIEPGLYGIQGSVGWGKLVGETGRTRRFIHTVSYGWALRGVVMRTWGNSPLTPQSQTLVGLEADYNLLRANLSVGVMRSLSSEAFHDWVFTAGLGWGY